MATDSISGLKQQVDAFLAILDPQISGNENFIRTQISGELRSAIQNPPLEKMHDQQQRSNDVLDAIDALLQAINNWEEGGADTPMSFTLPPNVVPEYTAQMSNLAAGATVYTPAVVPSSETINVTMSPPHDELPARSTQRRS